MSFQDVGKGSRPQRSRLTNQSHSIPEARSYNGGDSFTQLSDGILQYQRNVGILEKITRQIGAPADGPEIETQYSVQVDVLQQLGDKLETNLRAQEMQLDQVPREQAAKRRATLVKLSRDFRKIEGACKNLMLETRRKKARLAEQKKQAQFAATQGQLPEEEQRIQLELQLQQERLNEDIMREREGEIRNINRGMHQVNEIYKDLAHIVDSQQQDVDQIEDHMEQSRVNAEQGLGHIQKANAKASASQCTIS